MTWENAVIWVAIRDFVSQHLSMYLGFFRCRAPHTRPKDRVGSAVDSPSLGLVAVGDLDALNA